MEYRQEKHWFWNCIGILGALLVVIAVVTVVVDPYFHYHKPLSFLSYRIYEERYVNDGISRHFDYDAVITGTSMSQNFKTSELDALFDVNAVKEPFSGAGLKELSENLDRTLKRNPEVRMVVMPLDYNALLQDADWEKYEDYPSYLYDDKIFNDTCYIFNKAILYHGVIADLTRTVSGEPSTTMDEYSAWIRETGLQHILYSYNRQEHTPTEEMPYSEEDWKQVHDNIQENIITLVKRYPNTEFYFFYSPYSICYFDALFLENNLDRQFKAEQQTTEMLLQCPNVKLYNFFHQNEVICNLNYYNDTVHYSAEVNSMILQWIRNEDGLLTEENYQQKLAQEKEFFEHFDYDSIYEEQSEVTP